jgi:hypothetical protein
MFHLCQVAAGPHLLQAFHPRLQAAAVLHHRGAVHSAAGLTPAEDQGVLRGFEEEFLEPEAFPEVQAAFQGRLKPEKIHFLKIFEGLVDTWRIGL